MIGKTVTTGSYQESSQDVLESHNVKKTKRVFAALDFHINDSFLLNAHVYTGEHIQTDKQRHAKQMHAYTFTYTCIYMYTHEYILKYVSQHFVTVINISDNQLTKQKI